jgi:hypothetical protein
MNLYNQAMTDFVGRALRIYTHLTPETIRLILSVAGWRTISSELRRSLAENLTLAEFTDNVRLILVSVDVPEPPFGLAPLPLWDVPLAPLPRPSEGLETITPALADDASPESVDRIMTEFLEGEDLGSDASPKSVEGEDQ